MILVAVYPEETIIHTFRSTTVAGIHQLKHERNGATVYTECECSDPEFRVEECGWCQGLAEVKEYQGLD